MSTFVGQARGRAWLVVASMIFSAGCGSGTLVGPNETGDGGGLEDATPDVINGQGQSDSASPGADSGPDSAPSGDDGGVPDGSSPDAGSVDSGSLDGGPHDGGDGGTTVDACALAVPCNNPNGNPCLSGIRACDGSCTSNGPVSGFPSCGGGNFCNGGTCSAPTCTTTVADGGAIACTPDNPCHNGQQSCANPFASPGCTDLETNVVNCSAPGGCGADSVCSDGECTPYTSGGSCPFTNACEKGVQSCTVASGVTCDDSGTNEPPGTTCTGAAGANACDGNGNCSCVGGGACIIAGSCTPAAYSCATGAAVCTAGSGTLSNGSPCNADDAHYCYSGVCTPCTPNQACTPASPDECKTGAYVCTGSQPVCAAQSSNAPPGTACSNGADNACDGNGSCSCAAGGACTGGTADPCSNGVESCATGSPSCVSGSENVSLNGAKCGASQLGTCTSGRCQCPANYEFYEGDCNECPVFPSNTVYANAATGTDDVCCGRLQASGFGGPCQTATHALKQVGGSGWTVEVTGDASGNASPNESYPIELSGGVLFEGLGPGGTCFPGVSGEPVVEVDTDSTQARVSSMSLGTTCAGTGTGASYGVYVHGGGNVSVGDSNIAKVDQGIYVGPNSTAIANVNITGARIGINIDGGTGGSDGPGGVISGVTQDGLHCESVTNPSSPSVTWSNGFALGVMAAARYAVYAGPGCNAALQSGFYLGAQSSCPSPRTDNIGLYVEGNATVTVPRGGQISCMNSDGIVLANNTALTGSPTVNIDSGTLIHNGCAGIRAEAGSLTMTNTGILDNHWGVIQQTAATGTTAIVDLDGTSGANTFYCNGKSEGGACCAGGSCPNGASVWNDSALPLDAANDYWAASIVAKCTCNNALASCSSCTGSAFGDTTPPDDLDVLASPFASGGAAGAVTTTGNLVVSSPTCSY